MAEFGYSFWYESRYADLVRISLSVAKRRARALGCNIRYATNPNGPRCTVNVKGNTRALDVLGERLERDLPIVAEGLTTPSDVVLRIRLGRGMADLFLRGRDGSCERTMKLVGKEATSYWFPLIDDIDSDHLSAAVSARLAVTNTVVVAWHFGEVPPEVLLEELHTAFELVLEDVVNRRSKRLSFSQLLDEADRAGLLNSIGRPGAVGEDVRVKLEELKDIRKEVRHRGAQVAAGWVEDNVFSTLAYLERLIIRSAS